MSISATQTYEILPIEDVTLALEVAGNSVANKANVRLYTRNGGNSQKWQFVASDTTDVWYLVDAETNKACEVFGANDSDGANVSMYTANQSTAQKWRAVAIGTQQINGIAYETYQFVAFGTAATAETARCMDVQGNGSYIRSNIQIWQRVAGHPSQTFVLVPTEWNAVGGTGNDREILPTPADGSCGTTIGTVAGDAIALTSGTVYPAWKCAQDLYQVRYRTRTKTASTFGAWSDWLSISDGSKGFEGWGTVGAYNCEPTDIDGLKWAENGVSVDNSTASATEIQFSARAWSGDWGAAGTVAAKAHGGESTWSILVAKEWSITDVDVLLTPDGLRIVWASGAPSNVNATIESDYLNSTLRYADAVTSVDLPMNYLNTRIEDGDTMPLTLTLTDENGITRVWSGNAAASWSGTSGLVLDVACSVVGTVATVSAMSGITWAPSARCWLVIPRGHGTRYVPMAGEGQWTFPPPLGVSWQVLVTASDGTQWAQQLKTYDAIVENEPTYHITSQDCTRDLGVWLSTNSTGVSFEPSYSHDVESVSTIGRERPVNVFGNVTNASWSISGDIAGDTMDADSSTFDWAAHVGHAYFRSPKGFWAQVGIKSASIGLGTKYHHPISISMAEEVW